MAESEQQVTHAQTPTREQFVESLLRVLTYPPEHASKAHFLVTRAIENIGRLIGFHKKEQDHLLTIKRRLYPLKEATTGYLYLDFWIGPLNDLLRLWIDFHSASKTSDKMAVLRTLNAYTNSMLLFFGFDAMYDSTVVWHLSNTEEMIRTKVWPLKTRKLAKKWLEDKLLSLLVPNLKGQKAVPVPEVVLAGYDKVMKQLSGLRLRSRSTAHAKMELAKRFPELNQRELGVLESCFRESCRKRLQRPPGFLRPRVPVTIMTYRVGKVNLAEQILALRYATSIRTIRSWRREAAKSLRGIAYVLSLRERGMRTASMDVCPPKTTSLPRGKPARRLSVSRSRK